MMLDTVRRKLGWVVVIALGSFGCRPPDVDGARTRSSQAGSEAGDTAAEAGAQATDSGEAAWLRALDGALARGISPSGTDDGSYRVDSFVAVLLFEHLLQTGGQPIFEPIAAGDDPSRPAGGYRVTTVEDGSVYHRLGLREGDVVESINGVVLSSPDRFGFALDGAENRVRVTVYREDYSLTMSYDLADRRSWSDLLVAFSGSAPAEADDPRPDDEARAGAIAGAGAAAPDVSSSPATRPPVSQSGAGSPPSPKPAGSSPPPAPATPRASHVACASASQCTVAKAHFDALVASPQRLQSQVDVVPAIRNDVHSGYRLQKVRPGTSVADLGFRSGDKITHVNGYDLTNEAQAMQLYFSLAGSRIFKVRYERGTQQLLKTIVVK